MPNKQASANSGFIMVSAALCEGGQSVSCSETYGAGRSKLMGDDSLSDARQRGGKSWLFGVDSMNCSPASDRRRYSDDETWIEICAEQA